MHSVRLEPTKWIVLGTRTTYQATGDVCINKRRCFVTIRQILQKRKKKVRWITYLEKKNLENMEDWKIAKKKMSKLWRKSSSIRTARRQTLSTPKTRISLRPGGTFSWSYISYCPYSFHVLFVLVCVFFTLNRSFYSSTSWYIPRIYCPPGVYCLPHLSKYHILYTGAIGTSKCAAVCSAVSLPVTSGPNGDIFLFFRPPSKPLFILLIVYSYNSRYGCEANLSTRSWDLHHVNFPVC